MKQKGNIMTTQKSLDIQMWNAIRGRDSRKLDEGSLKALTVALDLGANPNCLYIDENGRPGTDSWYSKITPLLYITEHMYDESPNFKYQEQMAALLINKGADVNARDASNYTPLMNSAKGNALNTVKLLIAKGADINAVWGYGTNELYSKDWDVRTALGFARTPEMMQMLLDHGAEPNKGEDCFGNSPLHQVCEYIYYDYGDGKNVDKYLRMISMLLDHGADPDDMNLKLLTPMMVICGADIDEKYRKVVSSDVKLVVIKMLFEHGANINQDSYRRTALWFAAQSEDWPVVEALAFNGAVLNRGHVSGLSEEAERHALSIINDVHKWQEEKRRQEALKAKTTWRGPSEQKIADLRQGQNAVNALDEAKQIRKPKSDEYSM